MDGVKPLGKSGGEEDSGIACPVIEDDLAVGGRSSGTIDCLFARISSSSSSVISIRRRLRRELVDEDVEPEAVCNEHAAESVVSRSSFEVVIGKTVS